MFLKKLHALFHDIFLPIWLNEHSMKCLTFVSNEAIRMVLTLILGNRSIYFGGDTTHFVIMSYLLNYFFGYGYIKHFGYICKTIPSIRKIDAFFIICEFFRLSQKQINFELSVDCVEIAINEKIKKPYTKRVSSPRGGKNYQFLFNKGCEDCKDKQG